MNTYVAWLRGINVGGHHKVPMKDLKSLLEKLGFSDVKTLLNSGNVVFKSEISNEKELENVLENEFKIYFGFPISTIVCPKEQIQNLISLNPFANIKLTPDLRFYISFLKELPTIKLEFPWISDDKSFQIIVVISKMIVSYLDVSVSKTTKGMESMEKMYGKQITTRNWNTIEKIAALMG
ncbi:DUF1697 domain-containing protein [bacterium]|nr:MAG: DUF1697 domain-containing protein [bacterium]